MTGEPVDLSEDMDVVGNHRLIGYFRDNAWESSQSSYGEKSKEQGNTTSNDSDYRFQSLASDLILDGAFNINSTSVDAWIAQLSSLRGHSVENVNVGSGQTPVIRFLEEPETNEWNKIRLLSDDEIEELAKAIVKQVKLRGPFLSMADFVNRRLALGPMDSDTKKQGEPGSILSYMILMIGVNTRRINIPYKACVVLFNLRLRSQDLTIPTGWTKAL